MFQQESDYPIVVRKPMKVGGAKGITNNRARSTKHIKHMRFMESGKISMRDKVSLDSQRGYANATEQRING